MFASRNFSLGFLLLFVVTGLNAQSKLAQQVLTAEASRFEAMIRADTLALRDMLSDDLVYVHSNALKESKLAHMTAIASRKLIYEKMDREEANVRFYGKTALVNGNMSVRGKLKGEAFEIHLLYTAVYRKKRSTWQLVSWQSTRIP